MKNPGQPVTQGRIRFIGPHPGAGREEEVRQKAETGTDLKHIFSGLNRCGSDNALEDVPADKKILPQTVPGRHPPLAQECLQPAWREQGLDFFDVPGLHVHSP